MTGGTPISGNLQMDKDKFHDIPTMITSRFTLERCWKWTKNDLRLNTVSRSWGRLKYRIIGRADPETNLSKMDNIQQDKSTNPIKSNFQAAIMTNMMLQTPLSRVARMNPLNMPLSHLQLGEHHDYQRASVFLIHVIMLLAQASTVQVANSPSLTHYFCWLLI